MLSGTCRRALQSADFLESKLMPGYIQNILKLQLIILGFLVFMHFFPENVSVYTHKAFNLNGEANIPAWYSTVLLFIVSLCSLVIYRLSSDNTAYRKFWILFCSTYLFLSMDEAVGIHEFVGRIFPGRWGMTYAPLGAVFFIICVFCLPKLIEQKQVKWILGGLVIYATGGLAIEFAGQMFKPLPFELQQCEYCLEEGLEILGTTVVLTGCLQAGNQLWLNKFREVR